MLKDQRRLRGYRAVSTEIIALTALLIFTMYTDDSVTSSTGTRVRFRAIGGVAKGK
jgi:hypothetical protein